MTNEPQARIADRRRQWQQLPAEQRLSRIHGAVLRTIEIARWRRRINQRRTNDFLFPERSRKRDYV
jgi:hypothetical protein